MKRLIAYVLFVVFAVSGAVPVSSFAADEAAPVVLVTGANRGLGLEFARQYREAGWHVIGTARNPDKATELNELGVRVAQLDVTDADSIVQLASELDGQPIDLLINNAGILRMLDSLPEADIETVALVLDVNTLGPMRVTQALLPNLSAGDRKTIVNMTSGLGSLSQNRSGRFYGYRESKAALNMFTRTLAVELRSQGFIIIGMDPGWVQTDMGGPNASLTPTQSVSGIRSVVDDLTVDDAGTLRRHDGDSVPW